MSAALPKMHTSQSAVVNTSPLMLRTEEQSLKWIIQLFTELGNKDLHNLSFQMHV